MPNELYRDFIEDQFDRVVNAINNELPTPLTTDIGKFVGVVSDGGAGAEYSLENVPDELPTPTTADIGKVATVVSDGSGGAEYALNTPSGGLPSATGSGTFIGSDNYNWVELNPTPVGHAVVPYFSAGAWRYKELTPEATATYYGTLNLNFGVISRADFVNSNMTKVIAFNGMSSDFSKQYAGTIPCYGYQMNSFAVFKGIVLSNASSGRAEITINVDYSDSTKDSITITDL